MGNTERMLIFCLFFKWQKNRLFSLVEQLKELYSAYALEKIAQDALDYAGKLVYIFLFFGARNANNCLRF